MSVHASVAAARQRLRDAGIPPDEADLDARVLAEHLLGWDAARYFADGNGEPPPGFGPQYEAAVARRLNREPTAYITGEREFWNLPFEVSPEVLIPRPETELIVAAALEALPRDRPVTIADAGTGSGCLAIALAVERPSAHIVATDASDGALEVALRNARRHGVANRIDFVRTDLFEGIDRRFDAVVSNPPYVAEGDWPSLQPEVRKNEPPLAFLAGADGLAVIRRLLEQAPARMRDGGVLIFEFGYGQADAIAALISAAPGLTMIDVRRDLQGIPRIASVRRE